jgi:hypothetical protein
LGGGVGDGLAGGGVDGVGAAVPAGAGLALGVEQGALGAPGEHGVAAGDVAVVVHDGFGHGAVAAGADVPLQVADPQHEFGQRGGAGVDFEAEKLLRGDGFAFERELFWVSPRAASWLSTSPSRRLRCSRVT